MNRGIILLFTTASSQTKTKPHAFSLMEKSDEAPIIPSGCLIVWNWNMCWIYIIICQLTPIMDFFLCVYTSTCHCSSVHIFGPNWNAAAMNESLSSQTFMVPCRWLHSWFSAVVKSLIQHISSTASIYVCTDVFGEPLAFPLVPPRGCISQHVLVRSLLLLIPCDFIFSFNVWKNENSSGLFKITRIQFRRTWP